MAAGVRVVVSDELIIKALNVPGQPVSNWRDRTGEMIISEAQANSPINDPLDAEHRGGIVGTYAASWYWDRYGNQHVVGARVGNVADHAIYVEYGRSASRKYQRFSWTGWGGEIRAVGGDITSWGTGARDGKFILRDATNSVMPTRCAGYAPISGV